jgi:hypothetical protein
VAAALLQALGTKQKENMDWRAAMVGAPEQSAAAPAGARGNQMSVGRGCSDGEDGRGEGGGGGVCGEASASRRCGRLAKEVDARDRLS